MPYPDLTIFTEHDTEIIPTVWEGLFSYVFVIMQSPKLDEYEYFRLFASGNIRPITYDKVYTLEHVTEGLMALEKRETWGKVIIRVREDETLRARL
jgi:hypothetical protein